MITLDQQSEQAEAMVTLDRQFAGKRDKNVRREIDRCRETQIAAVEFQTQKPEKRIHHLRTAQGTPV